MSCDVSEATEVVGGGGGSAHSATLPSLHLCHSSFSSLFNPSVASSTSQLIIQTLPPLHLRHSSFSNPSVASPTSHTLHLRHLVCRPWATPPPEPNSRYLLGDNVPSKPLQKSDSLTGSVGSSVVVENAYNLAQHSSSPVLNRPPDFCQCLTIPVCVYCGASSHEIEQQHPHSIQWRILMNILGIPQVSCYIILPITGIVAFNLSIILVTYQIYWYHSSIRQDKKISLI